MSQQAITILGATGSIGQSTIDVVLRHPERFRVHALSGHRRIEQLVKDAARTRPDCVIVPTDEAAREFRAGWDGQVGQLPEVRVGTDALAQTASSAETDVLMAAIVGIAGLPAVFSAASAGKRVLLANKEALVAAGSLLMAAVSQNQATLLPIDSEHNAIFQCMPERTHGVHRCPKGVQKLILTASGGPFRQWALQDLADVTPEQACAHPNWDMGRKISVDSATMLNKGLEVIEAHWLFSTPADQIDVLIHPQSIVHSMVQYTDGSVLAQLGNPDMRTPIAHALGYPERINAGVDMLDLATHGKLEFEPVQPDRYPCLTLAYDALRSGQAACIALNAANEIAVAAFLNRRIGYLSIARTVHDTLQWQDRIGCKEPQALDDVLAIDRAARQYAKEVLTSLAG